ncbi:hypothetical protein MMC07_008088 [Pseudocyphellaria aurata]|nr:hypothetical protein [Pseudocyphellaria aurata]
MGLLSRFFRIPRPQSFLYLMSLRTGTELITLSLLLNKVSGLYGLLALLTGLHLSPLQLSMYIYSLFALILIAILAPHIRTQTPFHCLALAIFYILDSIVNAAYTTAFAITWFLVISHHHSDASGSKAPGAGGETIDDTAGFTSPTFNVTHVDVAVAPDQGIATGAEAVAVGSPGLTSTATSPSLGHGVLQPESINSIIVICALWAVRLYFILVVMSYARFVLRQHVAATSRSPTTSLHDVNGKSSAHQDDPFAAHLPEGKGWQGRMGRTMVSLGRSYWLGGEEGDEAWVSGAEGRFRKRADPSSQPVDPPGVVERERRRRSGTGPPPPMPQLLGGQGQFLRV